MGAAIYCKLPDRAAIGEGNRQEAKDAKVLAVILPLFRTDRRLQAFQEERVMLNAVKLRVVAAGGLLIVTGAASPAAGQQGLSRLPASPQAAAPGESSEAPETLSHAAKSKQLYDHVERGVVIISRGGVAAAVGTVLAGDGRILTALSGLGGSDRAEVRYADGTSVHARVGQSDRVFDLALLIPDGGRWTDGLVASESEPTSTEVRAMCPSRGVHLGATEADLKGPADAH